MSLLVLVTIPMLVSGAGQVGLKLEGVRSELDEWPTPRLEQVTVQSLDRTSNLTWAEHYVVVGDEIRGDVAIRGEGRGAPSVGLSTGTRRSERLVRTASRNLRPVTALHDNMRPARSLRRLGPSASSAGQNVDRLGARNVEPRVLDRPLSR